MDWQSIVEHLITFAIGGGLAVLLTIKATNRKTNAEADKTAAEAWALLATNQSTRIVKLETRLEDIEGQMTAKDKRIDELEDEIDELRSWIVERGLTPPERKRAARGKVA